MSKAKEHPVSDAVRIGGQGVLFDVEIILRFGQRGQPQQYESLCVARVYENVINDVRKHLKQVASRFEAQMKRK